MNGLSPEVMKEVFPFNENTTYNTRNERKFYSRVIKSVTFDYETLSHVAPKMWELAPAEIIKNEESVACFKRAIFCRYFSNDKKLKKVTLQLSKCINTKMGSSISYISKIF